MLSSLKSICLISKKGNKDFSGVVNMWFLCLFVLFRRSNLIKFAQLKFTAIGSLCSPLLPAEGPLPSYCFYEKMHHVLFRRGWRAVFEVYNSGCRGGFIPPEPVKTCRMLRFYRTMCALGREVGRRDVLSDIANVQKYIEKLLQASTAKKLNEA